MADGELDVLYTTYDDLVTRKKYESGTQRKNKRNHYGQIKLLCRLLKFIDLYITEPGVILYVGGTPGKNLDVWVPIVQNMGCRVIVWDPTKPIWSKRTAQNVEYHPDLFTDERAEEFVAECLESGEKVYLVSDIRRSVEGKTKRDKGYDVLFEQAVKKDMDLQKGWVLRFEEAGILLGYCLKFRAPYSHIEGYTYLPGTLHLQAYAPPSSTEMFLCDSLPFSAGALTSPLSSPELDCGEIEERLYYFNSVIRPASTTASSKAVIPQTSKRKKGRKNVGILYDQDGVLAMESIDPFYEILGFSSPEECLNEAFVSIQRVKKLYM